jgi:hypothetical protein
MNKIFMGTRINFNIVILTLCCFLSILPQFSRMPFFTVVTIGFLFIWRVLIEIDYIPLPESWFLRLVSVSVVVAAYLLQNKISSLVISLDAIITMVCVSLTLKLFELKAKRDLIIIYCLLLILISTNLSYSKNIITSFLCFISFILFIWSLISFQDERNGQSYRETMKETIKTFIYIIPIAAVFYLAMPMAFFIKLSFDESYQTSGTGMSDSMSPGDVSDLALSDDLAFSGKFLSRAPIKGELYWRAMVLNDFDGRKWTNKPIKPLMQILSIQNIELIGSKVEYEVNLMPNSGKWLPVLGAISSINADNKNVNILPSIEARTDSFNTSTIHYRALSYMNYTLDKLPSDIINANLQFPKGFNPKSKALAEQFAASSRSNNEVVNNVLNYFNREQFFYTLKPRKLNENSIDEFLFESREGFCEHYASAFVMLMRMAGVPSRVVTGYQGYSSIDAKNREFMVNQSEAHAWAEVWIEQKGWVRIDPTSVISPDRVINEKKPKSLSSKIYSFFGLNLKSFNLINLGKESLFKTNLESSKNDVESNASDGARKNKANNLILFAGEIISVLILLSIFFFRRSKIKTGSKIHIDLMLGELSIYMSYFGLEKIPSEGITDYRVRVEKVLPNSIVSQVKEFLILFEAVKYGNKNSDTEVIKLKSILSECKKSFSLRKRLFFEFKIATYKYL